MAIHESKKQSDLEKRLKLLRNQVYGKPAKFSMSADKQSLPLGQFVSMPTGRNSETLKSDLSYLNQDLIKIVVLSVLALGSQFILFFLLKNRTLNLNLF